MPRLVLRGEGSQLQEAALFKRPNFITHALSRPDTVILGVARRRTFTRIANTATSGPSSAKKVARGGDRAPPHLLSNEQRACRPPASLSSAPRPSQVISRLKITSLSHRTVSRFTNDALRLPHDALERTLHAHTTELSVARTTNAIQVIDIIDCDTGVFCLQAGDGGLSRDGRARQAHGPEREQHRPGRH